MKIISSQHYINAEIINEKVDQLNAEGATKVIIPCYYVGEIDGEEYAIQADGHHTLAAARELGLNIEFEVEEDPEGLEGEDLLDARYNDCDWYDVEESNPAHGELSFIW